MKHDRHERVISSNPMYVKVENRISKLFGFFFLNERNYIAPREEGVVPKIGYPIIPILYASHGT